MGTGCKPAGLWGRGPGTGDRGPEDAASGARGGFALGCRLALTVLPDVRQGGLHLPPDSRSPPRSGSTLASGAFATSLPRPHDGSRRSHAPPPRPPVPRLRRRRLGVDHGRARPRFPGRDLEPADPGAHGAKPVLPRPHVVRAVRGQPRRRLALVAVPPHSQEDPRRAGRAGVARRDGLRPRRADDGRGVGAIHVVPGHRPVVEPPAAPEPRRRPTPHHRGVLRATRLGG